MNKGLKVYQDRKDIFSICGYNYPVSFPYNYHDEIYLWSCFSAWGSGVWREKWEGVNWSLNDLKLFLSDKANIKKLNKIAEHLYPALKLVLKTGNIHGDTIISYHMIKKHMYTVFPLISRVRNTGHDGSGEHSGINKIYQNQSIQMEDNSTLMPLYIQPNPLTYEILFKFFKMPYLSRIKSLIKELVFN